MTQTASNLIDENTTRWPSSAREEVRAAGLELAGQAGRAPKGTPAATHPDRSVLLKLPAAKGTALHSIEAAPNLPPHVSI